MKKLLSLLCLATMALFMSVSCTDVMEDNPSFVVDEFSGDYKVVDMKEGMEDFSYTSFECAVKTPDGRVITRTGSHSRTAGVSRLKFNHGLKTGVYRLLYLRVASVDDKSADTTWVEHGLGCRVKFSGNKETAEVLDTYDSKMKLFGKGTSSDPYSISCGSQLIDLMKRTNDDDTNREMKSETHYHQSADISMDRYSWQCDNDKGWIPIGNSHNCPFTGIYDGCGNKIKNIWIDRGKDVGVGLFGFTKNAVIKNIELENPDIVGAYGVGGIVGCIFSGGDQRSVTNVRNCTTSGGTVKTAASSVGAGGMVGLVDEFAILHMDSCVNESTKVLGTYAIGGLVGSGAKYSSTIVSGCTNKGHVNSEYSGAGGLIGTVDTLLVMNSINEGEVKGATAYSKGDKNNAGFGAGGIVGGAGPCVIFTSTNNGKISGYRGVGGIIGSTCVTTEDESGETFFNDVKLTGCSNTGSVSGQYSVGGLCGEAQLACYTTYNSGSVTAYAEDAHVGGLAGFTSICVIYNSLNKGDVNGSHVRSAGGIVGLTNWGTFFLNQNYGQVNVGANYAGGMVGLAGNYTVINYCSNYGYIWNTKEGSTGGIVGEIGDQREWSMSDIATCVIGGLEIFMGVFGTGFALLEEKIAEKSEYIFMALFALEKLGDECLITTDAVFLANGIYLACIKDEKVLKEAADAFGTMQDEAVEQFNQMRVKINDLRQSGSLMPDILASGLSTMDFASYNKNVSDIVDFYEESDDNKDCVTFNMNYEREKRYESVEYNKEVREIVHKSIAGVCILAGAVAFIASSVIAPETVPAWITAMGICSSLVGGANAVYESCTNFQSNVVIVSQCMNAGYVNGNGFDNIGGIVGRLEQHGYVSDCINAGKFMGSTNNDVGAIVGHAANESDIDRCLNVGANWDSACCGDVGNLINVQRRNNYYFKDASNSASNGHGLTIEELHDKSNYMNWDFNSAKPAWKVTNKTGYFPMPYYSIMQVEHPEEED